MTPEEDKVSQEGQVQEALRPAPRRPLPRQKAADAPVLGQRGPDGQGGDSERPGPRQQRANVQEGKAPNPVSRKQRAISQEADVPQPAPEQPNSDVQQEGGLELRRPVWRPRTPASQPDPQRESGPTGAQPGVDGEGNKQPMPRRLLPRPRVPLTLLGKKLQEAFSGQDAFPDEGSSSGKGSVPHEGSLPDENRLNLVEQVVANAMHSLDPFQEGSARGSRAPAMPPARRVPMRGSRR